MRLIEVGPACVLLAIIKTLFNRRIGRLTPCRCQPISGNIITSCVSGSMTGSRLSVFARSYARRRSADSFSRLCKVVRGIASATYESQDPSRRSSKSLTCPTSELIWRESFQVTHTVRLPCLSESMTVHDDGCGYPESN